MKYLQSVLLVLFMLVMISSCGKDAHDLDIHKPGLETESVEMHIGAFWLSNDSLSLGGLLLGRGEGNSGVITVNLTQPGSTPTGPVLLSCADVTAMDINVTLPDGTNKHFGNPEITTAGYLIGFTYQWTGGPLVEYIIVNNYKCE